MIRIRLLLIYILSLLLVPRVAIAQEQPPLRLNFVGEQRIPTGTMLEGTEIGGISGISYDPKNDLYYAISDDRVEHGFARFYTLILNFDADRFNYGSVRSVTEIKQPDGSSFGRNGLDAEALVFVPSSGTLIWASERDSAGVPSISEMNTDGSFVRAFTLPDYYLPRGTERGVYNNLAFEAVQVSSDGKSVIAATENALMQDGAKASLDEGSPSRILVLDRETSTVTAEYIYRTGIIPHTASTSATQDNGLSDMLLLDDHTLLTVERSFAQGVGNTINLYTADLTNATNIKGLESIKGHDDIMPVAKTPVLTIHEGDFGVDIDNIEGVTAGPLIDGQATLILVSDNNFNATQQPYTQFLVFTFTRP